MIEINLKAKSDGFIDKEKVGAWLYTLLGSKYHDDGLYDYFNGSKVKAHCFYINLNKVLCNDILTIQFRGIDVIERKVLSVLSVGDEIRLGRVLLDILDISLVFYESSKDVYRIKSPVIMRDKNLVYRHEPLSRRLSIDELLLNSIKRKYFNIYGVELQGLVSIRLLNFSVATIDVKIRNEPILHKGYLGNVEIIGSDESKKFILEVGLGNRTSYGYGFIE